MKKIMLKTTLALAVSLASAQLLAAGFALNEQSISGMGTGYAGRSSAAEDSSTVYGNPAGMSRLKRTEISLGAAYIDAKTTISHASSSFAGGALNNPGSNDGDMVPGTAVPSGYIVMPLDDHWAFGLGMYAPYGLITDYESGFQGRSFGNKSKVQVITLQPTVSYAFNDVVSIGFGPTINRLDGELTSNIQVPGLGTENIKIKGDDTALGFNAGILVTPIAGTNLGLTYHSKVDYRLKGNTKASGVLSDAFDGGAQKYDASLDIATPESVDFSVTHHLNEAWTLYAGTTWTRWSRLKAITVNNQGVGAGIEAAAGLSSISEPQNWHNTWSHAVGAAYKVNKQLTLRTGLSFDQSPTNNTDRSVRIPTGDRTALSLGAGYAINDNVSIDVAYSYLREEPVKVSRSNALTETYDAKYKNSAQGFGAAITYKF